MITKHESISPQDPKLWKEIAKMEKIIYEHRDEINEKAGELTIAESVVIARYECALLAMVQAAADADPATYAAMLSLAPNTIKDIVGRLVALGKGLLPLDEFENVPEWVETNKEVSNDYQA